MKLVILLASILSSQAFAGDRVAPAASSSLEIPTSVLNQELSYDQIQRVMQFIDVGALQKQIKNLNFDVKEVGDSLSITLDKSDLEEMKKAIEQASRSLSDK